MKKNISVILAMLMLITVFTSCDNSNNNNTQNNGSNQNSRKPTWTDIVSVEAGGSHIVGLKRNGTVIFCGDSLVFGIESGSLL